MSVLIMLLRKMAKNRWLVASLFTGMLFCIALTSSMPIYKDAVLRYMLVKDLERSYASTGHHPGVISADITMRTSVPGEQRNIVERFERYWSNRIVNSGDFFSVSDQRIYETVRFNLSPADPTRINPNYKRSAKFAMRSGLEDHVRIVDGRLPSDKPVDGVYEVMVTDNALVELNMLLDQEFIIDDPFVSAEIRIKPVAVISENDLSDVYWNRGGIQAERNALFINERLFAQELLHDGPITLSKVGGQFVADYTEIDLQAASKMLYMKANMAADMLGGYNYLVSTSIWIPGDSAMKAYGDREHTLRNLLWSLNVPLFLLIAFYLYMVTGMLVERQKGEIAVLRSRGASRRHVVSVYALEFGLLALAAFAAGPWLGAVFTRVLGSTSTFMNFVNRGSLRVEITSESWMYALIAVIASWVLNLVPVVVATRATIVDQKRQKAREMKRPFWQTFGIDIVLIALALYGLYTYRQRMTDLIKLGLDGKMLSSDPLLYAVPSLFILGAGLLLIRIYPLLVRLVYWIGRSRWSPGNYSTLLLVSRRSHFYHGMMVFFILTIGTGIYNASTARTINGNMEDQIWYSGGSDIVLRQHWVNDAPAQVSAPMGGPPQSGAATGAADRISYLEPPFEAIESLPGVQDAARVFVKEDAELWAGNKSASVTLMGIDTDAFGRAAWMKDGLLPYHFYDYLNLIAPDTHAALVSSTLAKQLEVKAGDILDIGWEGIRPTRVTVFGIVDYFPTFNPNPAAETANERRTNVPPMLVVAHLDTVQNELALEPYDVWVKLTSYDARQSLLDAAAERGVTFERFEDTYGMIEESRADPFRMAINGVMSLGFIVSLIVSFIGFLLFWMLSLQGRMLQLGIFRAMGVSFRQLLGMLFLEQLLTTGAGFAIGIATGLAAGRIFVPLFQLSFDPGKIVPPFEVVSDAGDVTNLAAAALFMLAAALLLLAWLLKRMNVYQAVKLGED
ncbi:ABC transporter permease [Paenibacillus thermotolerans]|uniref:ABC transporter permease n=1 Tax=Paenibacillus thermotolerans TaxID=3027807 RepID=UPI002368A8F8|nr:MULTISPECIES: ABC transporter permease [unclassified Paenibacillus]